MVSQSLGVPRPGCVFTVIHHMCSEPASPSFQRTLQATEQVWQPMHLLRSNTQASWCPAGDLLPFFAIALSPYPAFAAAGSFSTSTPTPLSTGTGCQCQGRYLRCP